MTNRKRWAIIGGALGIFLVLVGFVMAVFALRERDAHLAELQTERDHICVSIASHLRAIVDGEGDSRLQNLHAYVSWRFGDEAINRACLGKPYPVSLDEAGTCWALRKGDETCYLEPLRSLHALYREQPWRSRRH